MTEPDDVTFEDMLDGLELWREIRPNTPEDWVGLAEYVVKRDLVDKDEINPVLGALLFQTAALLRLRGELDDE